MPTDKDQHPSPRGFMDAETHKALCSLFAVVVVAWLLMGVSVSFRDAMRDWGFWECAGFLTVAVPGSWLAYFAAVTIAACVTRFVVRR